MNVLAKYKQLLRMYRIPLYLCGLEVFDPNFRFNYRTLMSVLVCILYYTLALNTIIAWPIMSTLQLLSACGLSITGTIKLCAVIAYNKDLADIFVEMEKLSEAVSDAGRLSRRYKIFDKYIDRCKLINQSYHIIFTFGSLLICAYPVITYYFTKELVFPFACYVPFMELDPFTNTGYTITMALHSLGLFFVYNGTIGIDTLFIFAVVQCAVSVDIIQVQIEELNELLISHDDGDRNPKFFDQVRSSLNSIIKDHQAINKAVSRLGRIFHWAIAVQVGLSVVSLTVSLFMTIKTSWYVAYTTCVISLYQLVLYSVLGSVVQTKCEDVSAYVYDISWYLLPQKEKKTFHFLFMNAQETQVIHIAGLAMAILNVNTCVLILKNVYSYFMILLEVA